MANYQTAQVGARARSADIDAGLRVHMNKVYGTMSVGLFLTALAAWAISGLASTSDPAAAAAALPNGRMLTDFGILMYTTPLKWVMLLLPLGMVFGFGAAMKRFSASGVQTYFYVYAAVFGVALSSIFITYTAYSITQTFLITAISFAGLSLWGYTTKKDISGWGSFLIMGLIGLIVAMVVNIFLASPAIQFAISMIGVLIFAGLTAYDTQKIKTDYIQHAHAMDEDWLGKAAVMGALKLYLDFINLFMFLLSFLGNRN